VIILGDGTGPWFPIILDEKCDGCAKTGKPRCIEFCPNGVFDYRNRKAVVAYPIKCGNGCSTIHCSACAPLCHNRAISFPTKNAMYQQEAKNKKDLLRKTKCQVCGKLFWTNREPDVCFDCEK
jgi:NAD-dependent dihydropyrimidine dehydrogenase PreA subunit